MWWLLCEFCLLLKHLNKWRKVQEVYCTLGVWHTLWISVLPDKSINSQLLSKFYVLHATRRSSDDPRAPLWTVWYFGWSITSHTLYIKISFHDFLLSKIIFSRDMNSVFYYGTLPSKKATPKEEQKEEREIAFDNYGPKLSTTSKPGWLQNTGFDFLFWNNLLNSVLFSVSVLGFERQWHSILPFLFSPAHFTRYAQCAR